MKIVPNFLLTLLIVMLATANCFAAPDPPPPQEIPPIPPGLPIDGNIGFLVVAAIIFGLFKLNQYRNKKATI
ncbi:MAG TPA: hypothetical protein VF581_13605 [Flavobacterium sp.]